MEQGHGEVCEGGTGGVSVISCTLGMAFPRKSVPCSEGQRCRGAGSTRQLCALPVALPAAFHTGFAHVGGCAQVLLSERLMGEQRSKQDLNAALAPCACAAHRGKGCLEGTEKHKQIEISARLCPPQ